MAPSPPSLANKVALITGGAHRIGAVIARRLHAEGMDIILHHRHSREQAEALARDLDRARPSSVLLVHADLHQSARFPNLIRQIQAFRKRLDVLVNNASSFYPTPLSTADEMQWDDLIGINMKAPFFLAQQSAPLLRATKGCIVNLVDIHAERPLKDHPIYSIAKAGNAMMVKALARELGPDVRVNGIAPGAVLWSEEEPSEQDKQVIVDRTALRRTGEPNDIADALVYLIRDARYVTGQILAVDGGRTLQQ